MKQLLGVILVMAILPVSAQMHWGRSVIIKEPVWKDLYIAGGNILIEAPVHGDLVVAGGTVRLADSVSGDVLVAGGQVIFDGPVGDDIRCAGGEIYILKPVTGDVVVTGGTINIERGATVGNIMAAGGDIALNGKVAGTVQSTSGLIVINGSVAEGIDCRAENIQINGVIGGAAILASGNRIIIGNQAVFRNTVRYWAGTNRDVDFKRSLKGGEAVFDPSLRIQLSRWYFLGFSTIAGLVWYIGMVLLMIMIVQYLFATTMKRAGNAAWSTPLKAMGYGIVFWIGVPVASLIAFVSVIGVPVGIILIGSYLLCVLLATVIASIVGANWLNGRSTGNWGYWRLVFTALLTFIVLKILSFSPFLGWLLLIVSVCLATGAVLININWRKRPSSGDTRIKKDYMKTLLVVLMIPVLWGCSSSKITHSWKSDTAINAHYNKILVVGLNGDDDMAMRAKMEEHLVGDLKALGYQAIPSLEKFGPKALSFRDEDSVVNELKNSGIDAVITIVLLDKEKERYYVPGVVNYTPYAIYQRRFWGYYRTMYGRIYSPGYYTSSTRYFWESNLYDLNSKELLYSVQTESFDPASLEGMAHEYGRLIVKDIVKKKVLNKQEGMAGDNF